MVWPPIWYAWVAGDGCQRDVPPVQAPGMAGAVTVETGETFRPVVFFNCGISAVDSRRHVGANGGTGPRRGKP
jgi:hypothetical protein